MVSETHANGSRGRTRTRWPWTSLPCSKSWKRSKAAEVDDRIRQAAETIYQALIEAELSAVIGACPHQRTETRTRQRNGHRPRTVPRPPGTWS